MKLPDPASTAFWNGLLLISTRRMTGAVRCNIPEIQLVHGLVVNVLRDGLDDPFRVPVGLLLISNVVLPGFSVDSCITHEMKSYLGAGGHAIVFGTSNGLVHQLSGKVRIRRETCNSCQQAGETDMRAW